MKRKEKIKKYTHEFLFENIAVSEHILCGIQEQNGSTEISNWKNKSNSNFFLFSRSLFVLKIFVFHSLEIR